MSNKVRCPYCKESHYIEYSSQVIGNNPLIHCDYGILNPYEYNEIITCKCVNCERWFDFNMQSLRR